VGGGVGQPIELIDGREFWRKKRRMRRGGGFQVWLRILHNLILLFGQKKPIFTIICFLDSVKTR
jgi:hypothetical protein